MDRMDSLSTPVTHTLVRRTWLSRRPHARAGLLTAWCLLLLITGSLIYWMNFLGLGKLMPASGEAVFNNKELWRLWSALLAHANLGHLVANALGLFVLGYFLIGYFSLWLFPLAALILGGLANFLTLLHYAPQIQLLGFSGVVYWMGGAWLTLYLLLDQQRSRSQRVLRALGVALGVFMPSSAFDPAISYICHFYGFVLGVISAAFYYAFNRKIFLRALIIEQVVEDSPSEGNPAQVPPQE